MNGAPELLSDQSHLFMAHAQVHLTGGAGDRGDGGGYLSSCGMLIANK